MNIVLLVLALGVGSAPAPVLMTTERDQQYRKFLPEVQNEELQKILKDQRLILYTETEMPRAHQDWEGALQGVHSPWYNISGNTDYRGLGNGNREFPWGTPAGTHRSENVSSVRFLWLPLDSENRRRPIAWFRDHDNGGYAWVFPVGTVVGEVLMMKNPKEYHYTFELRTRKRLEHRWVVDAFRPFPTAAHLLTAIQQQSGWDKDKALVAFCDSLKQKVDTTTYTLVSNHPDRVAFESKGRIDTLPTLDHDLVIRLLTTTKFKSALGASWKPDSESPAAPTTEAEFHVIPKRYDAGFINVDSKSCMRCHNSTNEPVRQFENRREWYGRIRGSDGIFSFHPFDPSCISGNGFSVAVKMNQKLIDAGIIVEFDPKIHPHDLYNRVKGLK